MKTLYLILSFVLLLSPSVYARGKNLYNLVEGTTLKVYLADFKSDTEKILPESFKDIFKNTMAERKKESFEIVNSQENADICVFSNILAYKYLEKDPTDHIVGGISGLIVDALVDQNYVKVQVEFSVERASDSRRLWHDKFVTSVTQSNMPEPDSIPKVLKECSKRFIFLCFGKPKK